MMNEEVTGFVLSGGESKRLGEDKGLALFHDRPLVTHSLDTLKPICTSIFISANQYLDRYSEFGYEVIRDDTAGIGPIGGIISCLKRSKSRLNVVLSCDTPFVKTELFTHLLGAINGYQAAVPEHSGHLEPLCAVYDSDLVNELETFIAKGNYKLHDFFEYVEVQRVPVHPGLSFYNESLFTNINTRNQLNKHDEWNAREPE